MNPETLAALARQLFEAGKTRQPLRNFSQQHPQMTIDDGYAMQQASQINEPDHAPLMADMFFASGGDIPADRFIAPRVEVELAFILARTC